jgi:hypothetical protein
VFQGCSGGCEDLASGFRRSCEGDLLEVRVGRHPGAKVIPSADHIQNAGRKDLTNVVGGSKYCKRGKDRRLQDNGVAGQQRWCRSRLQVLLQLQDRRSSSASKSRFFGRSLYSETPRSDGPFLALARDWDGV